MIHQKTARGQEALSRLSTFEGIPDEYHKKKRQVIPAALRVMRLKPERAYTILGELADSVGWKHKDLLGRLEEQRKIKAQEFYERKKEHNILRQKAESAASEDLAEVNEVLEAAGYYIKNEPRAPKIAEAETTDEPAIESQVQEASDY